MATRQSGALPNEQYTVGWICAVQCELNAARLVLRAFGTIHADRPIRYDTNDKNAYLLGRLHGHNVVVATLPNGQYGTSRATSVAENLLRSFPNVRLGLMVGIAGGAPSAKNDVRLGDIVVGVPSSGIAGVFHYRSGKNVQGEGLIDTAHDDKPPALLLGAVSLLESKLLIEEPDGITSCVARALRGQASRIVKEFERPDPSSDRLYASSFTHRDPGQSCTEICDSEPAQIVDRAKWSERTDEPEVFLGLIASADELMKNALDRDAISREKDVLCFEMEAAGLTNAFPCLNVRGICNYADTHKNKQWKGYAALVAAAYATKLLEMIAPEQIGHVEKPIKRIDEPKNQVNVVCPDQQHRQLKDWYQRFDPSILHHEPLSTCSPSSGEWAPAILDANIPRAEENVHRHVAAEQHGQIADDGWGEDFSEGSKENAKGLVAWTKDAIRAGNDNFHLLATSRELAEICTGLNGVICQGKSIAVNAEGLDEDFEAYIDIEI
ncbi:NACHT and ankyrin domain protein [Stagonosporopsis vannaccii]|nr:NACHT and ankyrin domain protein [Stagonosporopsis vannaccii]